MNENLKQHLEKFIYLSLGFGFGALSVYYLPKIYKEYKEKERKEIIENIRKEILKYLKEYKGGSYE